MLGLDVAWTTPRGRKKDNVTLSLSITFARVSHLAMIAYLQSLCKIKEISLDKLDSIGNTIDASIMSSLSIEFPIHKSCQRSQYIYHFESLSREIYRDDFLK